MAHMQEFERIKVLFVAGFGPIVRDRVAGGKLYGETLNISFKKEQGGYLHTEALKGVRTFALWPLDQAAQSCFGKDSWPDNTPVPQAWLEFDVEDVEGAMGSDCHTVPFAGRNSGWTNNHSIDAGLMSASVNVWCPVHFDTIEDDLLN
jgi:hypothetical protein